MLNHVYFTVVTRDSRKAVEAYLYAHSEIIGEVVAPHDVTGAERRHLLIETTAASDTDTRERLLDRARYLGTYQANRLASGLHFPSQVYDLESDAVVQHRERTGVTVHREDYAQS